MTRRVLVTGTGATGVGASVLQALHAENQWETVAADAEPWSWGLYTADQGAVIPWAHDPAYLDVIGDVAKCHEVDAIIPGTEAETVLLAGHRDGLPVPVIANDVDLMHLMSDKVTASLKLVELGLPVIGWYPWERRGEALSDFGFPLVVKPSRNSSGSRDVHLVTSRYELGALDAFVPPGTIVQPYLGDADHEYTVGVVSGHAGGVIGSIVMRRKLTGLSLKTARNGAAISTGFSQGTFVLHPELQKFSERLAMALGSRGPLNLQVREHDGQFYVFEIHPRFSFSTGIRAAAGFNEPGMLLRDFLGESVSCPEYAVDVAAVRFFDHVLVPVEELL